MVAKRAFDLLFAAFGLLVLSPLLLVLAVAVKVSSRGPVLFWQRRIGQGGRPFDIVKFRSMVVNAENAGPSITPEGDPRVTRIGRVLRRTKLDELPQLWNVLVGEMSFVGPRPEVPRYVAQYTPEQRRVLALKPGITDLATLEFRREEEMLSRLPTTDNGPLTTGPLTTGPLTTGPRTTGPQGAEDGGRKTEDGQRTTDNGQRTTDSGQRTTVEEFYMEYCVPRKIELNLEYAKRASLWQDTLIILRTLIPFLARDHGRRTTDNGQRTTDYGPRTTDHGQRTTDHGQRTADNGQRTTDSGQRTTDYGPRTTDYGPRTTDNGQRTTDPK